MTPIDPKQKIASEIMRNQPVGLALDWSLRESSSSDAPGAVEIWMGGHLCARISSGPHALALRDMARLAKTSSGQPMLASYLIGVLHGLMCPRPMIGDTKGNIVGAVPGR